MCVEQHVAFISRCQVSLWNSPRAGGRRRGGPSLSRRAALSRPRSAPVLVHVRGAGRRCVMWLGTMRTVVLRAGRRAATSAVDGVCVCAARTLCVSRILLLIVARVVRVSPRALNMPGLAICVILGPAASDLSLMVSHWCRGWIGSAPSGATPSCTDPLISPVYAWCSFRRSDAAAVVCGWTQRPP